MILPTRQLAAADQNCLTDTPLRSRSSSGVCRLTVSGHGVFLNSPTPAVLAVICSESAANRTLLAPSPLRFNRRRASPGRKQEPGTADVLAAAAGPASGITRPSANRSRRSVLPDPPVLSGRDQASATPSIAAMYRRCRGAERARMEIAPKRRFERGVADLAAERRDDGVRIPPDFRRRAVLCGASCKRSRTRR